MTPDARPGGRTADSATVTVVIMAKAPAPGAVKTRLCPPYSPQQAAELAAASLADTLDAVRATPGTSRPVLALAGPPELVRTDGFDLRPQRGADLDERIAYALIDARATRPGGALVIGMDTPQVTPSVLGEAVRALDAGFEAVLGPATDGGFWALGLRRPDPALVRGVPMSTSQTGTIQLRRLVSADLSVHQLGPLTDVDDTRSAHAVAAEAPGTRFAQLLSAIDRERAA